MNHSTSKSNKIASGAASIALLLSAGVVAMLCAFQCSSKMFVNDKLRELSIKMPETTELKVPITTDLEVPKVVHYIWLGKEQPAYVKEVIKFSTELANKQGFVVKVWNDTMADDLINTKYQLISKQWNEIKKTKRHDKGTRLADVARYAVIHSEGGIYLDADFVPCADLNELVGPPGYASFPWAHFPDARISNGIFSASPGHPLLGRALAMLSKNNAITWFGTMNAAGPHFLAQAVKSYTHGNLANAMIVNKREALPSKVWYSKPMFKLRFGRSGAMKLVNWVHLGYNSWFGRKTNGQCEQEEKIHKIRPFLEEACFPKTRPRNKWSRVWRACS